MTANNANAVNLQDKSRRYLHIETTSYYSCKSELFFIIKFRFSTQSTKSNLENAKIRIDIAREIEIFSIFAWLVPTLVPKYNSRFRVFRSTIVWLRWSINIYEAFCRNKIAVSLWNLVFAPCSETGPHLKTLLFVDSCLIVVLRITKLCTEENISILKQTTLWTSREKI